MGRGKEREGRRAIEERDNRVKAREGERMEGGR